MLKLCRDQRSELYQFIAGGHNPQQRIGGCLEHTLTHIMMNVNVRKTGSIPDLGLRALVDSAFEVITARHLLESHLISLEGFASRIDEAQSKVGDSDSILQKPGAMSRGRRT